MRRIWTGLLALVATTALAGSPTIFQGQYTKFLTPYFNIYDRVQFITGTADPSAEAVSAAQGSLYLRYGASGGTIYAKQDAGSSTNWRALSGDVTGPASSTDNALVRFNGTTGKSVQDSLATLSDLGLLTTTDLACSSATASTVPYFDADKKLVSSAITPTELGYLSEVTSDVQAQINAKEPTIAADASDPTLSYWRGDKSWATLDTGVVPENGNLYYTEGRFDTAFAAKTTDGLTQGATNKYYAESLFDASLAGKTTDNVTQGATNKYYAESLFDASLAGKTTDNLTEGASNKYFAQSLARGSVSGSAPISYEESTGVFSLNDLGNADLAADAAIDWSKVNKSGSNLTDIATRSHTSLSDIGTTSHADIDTALGTIVPKATVTTAGDLIVASGNAAVDRLGVGSDGQTLIADATDAKKMRWANLPGGTNYVKNYGAETAVTTGWLAYDDGAVAVPVDGKDGSPDSSISTGTGAPLRGTRSFLLNKATGDQLGEGVAYQFTIDNSDLAKVIRAEFDYEVINTSGDAYATGDIKMFIVADPNGVAPEIIYPVPGSVENVVGTAKFSAEFQAHASYTTYALCFHVATQATGVWSIKFDSVRVGPYAKVFGAPVTDWVTWTPTGSWDNTVYTGVKRRVGDHGEYVVKLTTTATPPASTAAVTVNLPAGEVIDSAKTNTALNVTAFGEASLVDTGNTSYVGTVLSNASTSNVRVALHSGTGTANVSITKTVPFAVADTDTLTLRFSVPIVGWSSSVQMSDAADTRVVGLLVSAPSGTLNSSMNDVTWGTVTTDTHGTFSGSTWTVPVTGYYNIAAQLNYTATFAAGETVGVEVIAGGVAYYRIHKAYGASAYDNSNVVINSIKLTAGQTVHVHSACSGTTPAFNASAASNMLSISKVGGPSQIAASEKIIVAAENTAGTAIGLTMDEFPFPTEEIDTHEAFNAATGIFTCPRAGKYRVSGAGMPAVTTTSSVRIGVLRDGTEIKSAYAYVGGASIGTAQISVIVSCAQGGTLGLGYRTSSAQALTTSAGVNYINIESLQ